MMKWRYLVPIPVLAAIVWIGVRTQSGPTPAVAPPVVPGITRVEQAAQHEAANRLAQMAPPAALATGQVGTFSAEEIRAAEDTFRRMVSVRGLITQDKERQLLAQQVLATPTGSALMRAILLDPAFARGAFGAFQAEARFYAGVVLDEVARQGDVGFVVDTAASLAGQLSASAGEPDKGRSEDLVDVVSIISRHVGSQSLLRADSGLLAKLGFAPGMPPSVRSLYVHGIFQGVWKAEGIERAQATAKQLASL
ncbi:MAG: hypothetical protein H7138_16900 [Myxococcales bacterium]|nr:hypothetical protein [Myxococcales bacterium]